MNRNTPNWKKLLQAATLSVFALAPIALSTQAAQADTTTNTTTWNHHDYQNDDHDSDHRYDNDDHHDTDHHDGDADHDSDHHYDNDRDHHDNNRDDRDHRHDRDDNHRYDNDHDWDHHYDRDRDHRYDNDHRYDTDRDHRYDNGYNNGNYGGYNNSGNYDRGRNTFTGVVTSANRGARRLTVDTGNGTYSVSTIDTFSSSISRGDRVRIVGDFSSSYDRTVSNARVELLNDTNRGGYNGGSYNGGYNGGYNGVSVKFPATVISVDRRANTMRVRGDNGREYFVNWRNADDYRSGQRVRIYGTSQNGQVFASNVDHI